MFHFKLGTGLILLTLVAVSSSSAQGTCVGSPEPVSFTDNFSIHPSLNPAWRQNDPSVTGFSTSARTPGTISSNIFTMVASQDRINFLELKEFFLAKTTWSISFDFRFESVDDTGDGIFALLYHRRNCKIVDKNVVELDTVKNAGRDPHDGGSDDYTVTGTGGGISLLGYRGETLDGPVDSISFLSNSFANHLAYTNQEIHYLDFTASGAGAWKNCRIEFLNGRYRVYLNNNKVLDHTLTVNYDDTILRFAARNGSDAFRTKVKNLSISSERNPSCPTYCSRLPEKHGS